MQIEVDQVKLIRVKEKLESSHLLLCLNSNYNSSKHTVMFQLSVTVAHKCNTQNRNLEHRNKTWKRKKIEQKKN